MSTLGKFVCTQHRADSEAAPFCEPPREAQVRALVQTTPFQASHCSTRQCDESVLLEKTLIDTLLSPGRA